MANGSFEVLPAPDSDVFSAVSKIWAALGSPSDATYSYSFLQGNDAKAVSGRFAAIENDEIARRVREGGGMAVRSLSLSAPNPHQFTLTLERLGVTDRVSYNLRPAEQLTLTVDIVLAIRAAFQAFAITPSIDQVLGPALAEFYRRREEGLVKLESTAQSLIQQTTAYREQLDLEFQKERARLRAELEHDHAKRLAQLEEERTALAVREGKLAEQLKVLDDRSHTHARRQLRSDLRAELAKKGAVFSLTTETNRKRRPVHALFIVLIVATGAVVTRELFNVPAVPSWPFLAELTASVLSLIGSIAFYIRWNDTWAREHASEEFKMHRLNLDVDRASWVVEVALEWKEEKGTQIPAELLDRLTNNLFANDAGFARVRHPAEDLASLLLGASTAVRVGVPGTAELSFDRKGVQRLKKEVAAAE